MLPTTKIDRDTVFRTGLLLVCAAGMVCLSACRRDVVAPEPGPAPVATVGTHEIHARDIVAEATWRQESGQPVPDKATLLQEMIAVQALLQRAEAVHLTGEPDVARAMQRLLIGKLKERELVPQLDAVQVSDDEVRASYEQQMVRYTRPAMVRLAVLFLAADKNMSDAKRAETTARLEEARTRIVAQPAPGGRGPAATGFGALAIDYSDDQASRYRGGDIGWMVSGAASARWPQTVLDAGFGLAKGEVSTLITTDSGMCLVMKTDAREASVTSLNQVAPALRQELVSAKRRAFQKDFIDGVVQTVAAEVNDDVLAALSLPAAAAPRIAKHDAVPGSPPFVTPATEN